MYIVTNKSQNFFLLIYMIILGHSGVKEAFYDNALS